MAATDPSLALLQRLTRALPPVKGAGAVANLLKRAYVRRPRRTVETEVHGFTMRLDPHEFIERELIFTPQLYDRVMIRYLRENLRPDENFLDGGANVGMFSLIASRLAAHGRVVAVEADPETFRKLEHHLKANEAANVHAVRVALADRDGTLKFAMAKPGNRGTSGLYQFGSAQRVIEVEGRPLARVMRESGVDRFHGMKLDLEGAEFIVLRRFLEEVAPESWPRFVILEQHEPVQPEHGGNARDLLLSRDYRVVWRQGADYILERS